MSSEPLIEEVGDLIDGSINRVAQAVQDHPDHLPVQIGWTIRREEGKEGTLTESKISSRTIAPELSTSKSLKAQPTSSWNLENYVHWGGSIKRYPMNFILESVYIRGEQCYWAYMIFVIIFTLTHFEAWKFYTQKCVICDKNFLTTKLRKWPNTLCVKLHIMHKITHCVQN